MDYARRPRILAWALGLSWALFIFLSMNYVVPMGQYMGRSQALERALLREQEEWGSLYLRQEPPDGARKPLATPDAPVRVPRRVSVIEAAAKALPGVVERLDIQAAIERQPIDLACFVLGQSGASTGRQAVAAYARGKKGWALVLYREPARSVQDCRYRLGLAPSGSLMVVCETPTGEGAQRTVREQTEMIDSLDLMSLAGQAPGG